MAKRRSIATLGLSVVARTTPFHRRMKAAAEIVRRFGRTIANVTKRLVKFSAVAIAAAGTALAYFIRQSFQSLDALAKTSDRLGLAADTLRGFERAATLTGSSIKTLRKAFLNVTRNIADAAAGTGEAVQAVKDLGVNAETLIALPLDEMMFRIAGAMARIPTQAKKIQIAADLLTIRGSELINMFDLGEQRLRAIVNETGRIVGNVSRLDLALIERANDAFADMRLSLRGIADRLAIEVAPMVELISKRLMESFIGFRERLTTSILPAIKGFLVRALNVLHLAFERMRLWLVILRREVLLTAVELQTALANAAGVKLQSPTRLAKMFVGAQFAARGQRARLAGIEGGGMPLLGDRIAKAIETAIANAGKDLAEIARRIWLKQLVTEFTRTFYPKIDPLFKSALEWLRKTIPGAPGAAAAARAAGGAPSAFAQFGVARARELGLPATGAPRALGVLLARSGRVEMQQLEELQAINRGVTRLLREGGLD